MCVCVCIGCVLLCVRDVYWCVCVQGVCWQCGWYIHGIVSVPAHYLIKAAIGCSILFDMAGYYKQSLPEPSEQVPRPCMHMWKGGVCVCHCMCEHT